MSTTLTISSGTLVVGDISPFSPIQSVTAATSSSPGMMTRNSAWTVVVASGTGRVQPDSTFQLNDRLDVCNASGGVTMQVSTSDAWLIAGVHYFGASNGIPSAGWIRRVSSYEWYVPQ